MVDYMFQDNAVITVTKSTKLRYLLLYYFFFFFADNDDDVDGDHFYIYGHHRA